MAVTTRSWKICLYIINAIFAILAVAIIAVGVITHTGSVAAVAFLPTWIIPISIASGGVFLLIVIIGCCGTKKSEDKIENEQKNWWLIFYAFIMALLCIVQIAAMAGVASYADLGSQSDDVLQAQIEKLSPKQWSNVQDSLSCCGFTDNSNANSLATGQLFCGADPGPPCKEILIDNMNDNTVTFMAVFGAIIGFGLFAFISATCLACCNPVLPGNNGHEEIQLGADSPGTGEGW